MKKIDPGQPRNTNYNIDTMDLQTPLKEAGRVYKMFAGRLEKLGIRKFEDFLFHIPHRYEDYSLISKVRQIQPGELVTIQGEVTQIKNVFTKRFKKIQEGVVRDETGEISVIWFNQPYITNIIHTGDKISLSGRIEWNNRKLVLTSPEYEVLTGGNQTIHTGRLVPVYPETKGVSSKWIRKQVYKIIYEFGNNLREYIPYSIIENQKILGFKDAIEQIHFPKNLNQINIAKHRLAFDEVFLLQLAAEVRRREWQKDLHTTAFEIKKYEKKLDLFWEKLPFELTGAQRKAVHGIFTDLEKTIPMNRLLQGDVGSGKTVVAAAGIYLAYLNGFQSVLIAPTEILAQQHFKTLKKLLEPLGLSISLTTGSKKLYSSSERSESRSIKGSSSRQARTILDTNVLVGTHAVLSEKIIFKNLGFVAIDEQQRFGVEQRAILRKKGNNPHVLTMTATPIPRTVALTLYGDLELSVLDEMPKGRKLVKTWLVPNAKRESGYTWIEEQIKNEKSQAFVVCPFIEESENMTTVKAATKEFEHLQKNVFPKLKLALLHGKMKAKEKDTILEDFRNKKYDILVATPVVEVGIDIPNATIIVIEAAERFGLSQLHQLRGRVGRGDKQSYCLLYTESQSPQTRNRLASLEKIYNGAELAELDLRLRGAGDIYGTQQSGWKMLKIASFSDIVLIEQAKREAAKIFPDLQKYPLLLEKVEEITSTQQISPD